MQYMIPLLFCSRDASETDQFIARVCEKRSIPTHAVFHMQGEKSAIVIDQVRELQRFLKTKSGDTRLIVLHDLDTASAEVQNALLKTLEEKSAAVHFIITARSLEGILPTIRSRSTAVYGKAVSETSTPEFEDLITDLLSSVDASILAHPKLARISKEQADLFFSELLGALRAKMRDGSYHLSPAARLTLEQKQLLMRNNLNPQLAVDAVCLDVVKRLAKK